MYGEKNVPSSDRDQTGVIADACLAIGTPAFGERLLSAARAVTPVDRCVVSIARQQKLPPECLLIADRGDLGIRISREYFMEGYRDDPVLPWGRTMASRPAVVVWRGQDFSGSFRERFFRRLGIIDAVGCYWGSADRLLSAGFFRYAPNPPYSESECVHLSRVIPIFANLAAAHSASCGPFLLGEPADAAGTPEEEIQRLTANLERAAFWTLTERERQVCVRILFGYSTEEIARQLGIGLCTVNSHRSRAYERLGISSQSEIFSLCLNSLAHLGSFPHQRAERGTLVRTPEQEVQSLSEDLGCSPFDRLTERERQVCFRILLGYSSEATGLHLGVAKGTVIAHRKMAYAKLGIFSQSQLFLMYLRSLPRRSI